MTVASAEDSALPGISWTMKLGRSYLVINLAAGEVMVIVVLVFALATAFLALCRWSFTRMMKRLGPAPHPRLVGAVRHDQARPRATGTQATRHSATGTQATRDSASSAAPADRGIERRAEATDTGPGGHRRPTPADRYESVERTLAGEVSSTELTDNLNRCTLKTLQQTCRDLHIKIGGTKEEVVRRLTAHMIENTPGERRQAKSVPVGMSKHSRSESDAEALLSIEMERLAVVRLSPPARQT